MIYDSIWYNAIILIYINKTNNISTAKRGRDDGHLSREEYEINEAKFEPVIIPPKGFPIASSSVLNSRKIVNTRQQEYFRHMFALNSQFQANIKIYHEKELKNFVNQCKLNGYEFDFIIDDGSHHMRDQQITLYHLFPLLKSNFTAVCATPPSRIEIVSE